MNLFKVCLKYKYASVGILFFILALFAKGTIDVAVADTYFVIAKWHILVGFGVIFLLFEGVTSVFGMLNKPFQSWLISVHWTTTVLSLVVISICLSAFSEKTPEERIVLFKARERHC